MELAQTRVVHAAEGASPIGLGGGGVLEQGTRGGVGGGRRGLGGG